MMRSESLRKFPKTGSRNLLARQLLRLTKRPAHSKFLAYQTQTALHLPFASDWYVYWGGRSPAQNRHVTARDQRFAYDFLILAPGNPARSYQGSGENNSDYYSFGQPIYAPADGAVVDVENEVLDNVPGEMNTAAILGNYVILDHGHGEYSFLAHFERGSVAIRKGDRVRCGQLLARCGNSGNSSEPHLHYHLQNTAVPLRGDGLPAFFVEYVAEGKSVARGEPVARQTVRSQFEFGGQ